MRIDKFLSQLKYTTRSQANAFLKKHVIKYDGKRIINGSENVDELKEITIDEVKVFYKDPIHLVVNKPQGYLSATKDMRAPCVVDLLEEPYMRFDFSIAGRLDIDTEGLLILSTDGQFIHELTHPKKHIEKEYVATLNKGCTDASQLLKGVHIKDDKNQTYFAKAIDIKIYDDEVNITIDEGKFHQVKRMFEAIGYKVVKLKRIRIGKLYLKDLNIGEYQEIRKEDVLD